MIHYRNDVHRSGVNGNALVRTAKKLLAAIGSSDAALSLTLVTDDTIRSLNRRHRGKDKPTDVLSYPLHAAHEGAPESLTGTPPAAAHRAEGPERLLGDVVISVETAARQAADYGAPLQHELYRLLIHGLLHVVGHDHERVAERR
ncbi:MAG TPA: rRNA maturation RNase YbeY, partial [Candidatus Baltobacteraceae bacterium]|nr:rRNA maturation RNase YbeY [Candidatus Baltobacteraceae bacterium]